MQMQRAGRVKIFPALFERKIYEEVLLCSVGVNTACYVRHDLCSA